MKPIKLTMTAFGPYKDQEEIDFTKLHEHGIFVVSGATGAGKTTIFDAITFALYDSGSGEDREKSLFLRSDFADASVDTEVELEFEVRGRIYRIWRKFGHDGTSAKREFYEITDGRAVPAVEKFQVKLVQAKVEELIGLTQSQFNQIVMLPQGEFQKLLTSESKHKEEIFRKIFKTERFTKMVELLREKKKEAENLYSRAKMGQDHTIKEIQSRLPVRESALFSAVGTAAVNMYQFTTALKEEQGYYEEQCNLLKKQYEESKAELQQVTEALSEQKVLNERIEKYRMKKKQLEELMQLHVQMQAEQHRLELARKANQIEPLDHEHEKTKHQLEHAGSALKKAQQEYEKAQQQLREATAHYNEQKQQEPLVDNYTKVISRLEQLLPVYESIDEQRTVVKKLADSEGNARELFEKLRLESVELKARQQQQQTVIQQLEEAVSTFAAALEAHTTLTKKIELAKEVQAAEGTISDLTAVHGKQQQRANEAHGSLQQMEQQLRSNHAAFLAATLHTGEACPVCGSIEHPAVHTAETLQIDEKALDLLRKESELALKNYYQIQSKLEVAQKALEEKQSQLAQWDVEVADLPEYGQQLSVLNSQLALQKQQQLKLATEKKTLGLLTEQEQVLQGRLEKGKQYVTEINQQLAQEKGKLEQIEKALLPQYTTVQQVNTALSDAQKKQQELKQMIQQAAEMLQKEQLEEKSCEINHHHTKHQLTEKQQEHHKARQAFEMALSKEGFQLDTYKQAQLSLDVQQQLQHRLEEYKQNVHTLTIQIAEEKPLLEGKEAADLSILAQKLNLLDQQAEANYSELKLKQSYITQCEETLEKLEQTAQQLVAYEAKLTQVEHVYDLIRGQNEAKISFERFAQIGYLEKVTHAANERLRLLSNGQYFLKSTGRKEGNAQSGLSIDVYDSNTGQTRDVKTLSGGEKFNASLSLALGMADVIQSVQGSVHIDTMFIDEGFGTLDEEALRRAIDVLIDLQQTGRLIGVISHVAELKAAMPAILQVQKLKEGHSKTEILIK